MGRWRRVDRRENNHESDALLSQSTLPENRRDEIEGHDRAARAEYRNIRILEKEIRGNEHSGDQDAENPRIAIG